MMKPPSEWPGRRSKAVVVAEIEKALREIPGNNYEFTQPIQMRFNELIAGVRSDVAVKLFGDDMDVLHATGQQIERALEGIQGASDVKLEQFTGLPVRRAGRGHPGNRATGDRSGSRDERTAHRP